MLAAVAITSCGGGGGHHSASSTASASTGGAVAVVHHRRRHPPSPSPGLIRLRAALNRVLRQAGPATGAAVYDLTTGTALYAVRDEVRRPPASVEKLYTSIASVRMLGRHARLHTAVLGTGHLGPGGVWHGNLYLKGGGDPTFGDGAFNKTWELGYGPTAAQLATQLVDHGIHRVTGKLIGDGSIFDAARGGPATGYAPDIPDFGGQLSGLTYDHGANLGAKSPEEFAAKQLAATMRAQHVAVRAAPLPGAAPRHAHRLAIVSSPPLSVLISLMDVPSDDLFAEMLTKQLGKRFAHDGSISAGAKVISHEIADDYQLHPRILDGSGLSRDDRSSPGEVVALLHKVWHTGPGHILAASLPVLGVSGTTRRIGKGTVAQGRCIAKTGTLNYVTNLAGYCHARGGHMLTFALFIDGPSNEQSIALMTKMSAAIASY
jgi:D-alanyl-D-alanine carboxypeptidase/D-alanyl-D-alanine-endopeptidase (penicillin-binding protein 4)